MSRDLHSTDLAGAAAYEAHRAPEVADNDMYEPDNWEPRPVTGPPSDLLAATFAEVARLMAETEARVKEERA